MTLVALLAMTTCAWAQVTEVTPTPHKNEWTFAMPDYDIELEIEYETELAPDSMAIKKLTSSSLENGTLTLNFEDADEIEAGKPYLVKVPTTFSFAATPFAGIKSLTIKKAALRRISRLWSSIGVGSCFLRCFYDKEQNL